MKLDVYTKSTLAVLIEIENLRIQLSNQHLFSYICNNAVITI
jgi:hypothetical protein